MADLAQIAPMTEDEYLRPWWWMADDLRAWLRREVAEERGPSRAICLPNDDRALGRVAIRLPQFASDAVRCAAVQASDQPAGELSYWLLPDARGRGVAFTAVTEMMEIGASTGLKSLVFDVEEENRDRGNPKRLEAAGRLRRPRELPHERPDASTAAERKAVTTGPGPRAPGAEIEGRWAQRRQADSLDVAEQTSRQRQGAVVQRHRDGTAQPQNRVSSTSPAARAISSSPVSPAMGPARSPLRRPTRLMSRRSGARPHRT